MNKPNPLPFVAVVALLSGMGVKAQDNSFLTNGLAAHYRFNGNANDESGNGNTGTPIGVTLASDRFGNDDSCYRFTGVNSPQSFIRITNAPAVQFPADFTFSAWIKFSGGTQ